jgi:hypothetical protein
VFADTPEDWRYDPDPMIRERTVHLDGGDTTVIQEVVRRPRDARERALLQNDADRNAEWLFDPACPRECKRGWLDVPDYPDDPVHMRLSHAELCPCVTPEFFDEEEA